MTLAQKEQARRRAILIVIKNFFQKEIESGNTIERRNDGSFINLKAIYDDLQNFLYGTDRFTGEPYLLSIEEVEYYQRLLRETKKAKEEWYENFMTYREEA